MRICQNLTFITCYIFQGNNRVMYWLNCITFALIVLLKAKIVLLVCLSLVSFISYVLFQKCECGNMCSRKSGIKKGCPCRDLDRHCTSICNCGKKSADKITEICKNRVLRPHI